MSNVHESVNAARLLESLRMVDAIIADADALIGRMDERERKSPARSSRECEDLGTLLFAARHGLRLIAVAVKA